MYHTEFVSSVCGRWLVDLWLHCRVIILWCMTFGSAVGIWSGCSQCRLIESQATLRMCRCPHRTAGRLTLSETSHQIVLLTVFCFSSCTYWLLNCFLHWCFQMLVNHTTELICPNWPCRTWRFDHKWQATIHYWEIKRGLSCYTVRNGLIWPWKVIPQLFGCHTVCTLLPAPFLLSHSVFDFIFFLIFGFWAVR